MLKNIKYAFFFVGFMWIIQIVNFLLNYHLNNFGIFPREPFGLIGIVCSPFLHGSFSHIISNTIPLFILLVLLFTFYYRESFSVIMIIILFGGLLLWITGEPNYHVGASLLIYGLAAFLFLTGILRKKISVLIVSIAIAIIYGGMVWGLLPRDQHISWIGHICGAVAGLVSSVVFRKNKYVENREV